MTREEVAEIIMYCKEHKVTYKSRLAELNIPVWRFYDSKSRYAEEQSSGNTSKGDFIELGQSGHLFLSRHLPVRTAVSPKENHPDLKV